MAAPNSDQIRPSDMAKTAPAIQPRIASVPPMAATISGSVMNGPTPIMSTIFNAVAGNSVRPSVSVGRADGESFTLAGWSDESGLMTDISFFRALFLLVSSPENTMWSFESALAVTQSPEDLVNSNSGDPARPGHSSTWL